MTSTSPPASCDAHNPTTKVTGRRWVILGVLVVAQLTLWLDNTILNVALKTLADPVKGVGASPSELQWSISSYTLLMAALLFTGGALSDRYGHRRMLLCGLLLFGSSSVWAAYSGGARELIVARAVMGVGSAMVMPATLSVINWVFDARERATAIAIWSGSSGLAIAAGPLVSGALLDNFWWGSVFLINVPFVVVALVGGLAVVPEARGLDARRFDPVGVALSTAGLLALVYGVINGGHAGEWGRADVLGPSLGGLLLLVAFVLVELRLSHPSFDVRLFRESRFAGASIAVMLTFFGLTGSMYYSTFYLQGVRGQSPWECGLNLAPVALGVALGAPVSARLVRQFGTRNVVAPAMLVAAGTFFSYVFFGTSTPMPWFWLMMVVSGFSLGAVMAPTTEAIMATLPPERSGAGSAVNNAMRQVGGVLGVAVLGSVLSASYKAGIASHLAGVPDAVRSVAQESAEATRAAATPLRRPGLVDAANDTFISSMHLTTVVGAAVAALGVLVIIVSFRRDRDTSAALPGADAEVRLGAEVPAVADAATSATSVATSVAPSARPGHAG